jgi:hypothetical protein|tara:strand:- start:952 stop:1131 length:180 start_codon:yes stop_codon:yes gene_type:complete
MLHPAIPTSSTRSIDQTLLAEHNRLVKAAMPPNLSHYLSPNISPSLFPNLTYHLPEWPN